MQEIAWPFRATEALDAGLLTLRELRHFYTAIYPGVWVPRGVDLTLAQRGYAAWLWSGRNGVLAGLSAAALLGAKWIEADAPVELIHHNRRAPLGISVHSERIPPSETQQVNSVLAAVPVTTPARTVFDLGRWLPLREGIQRVDALMNATDVKVVDVEAIIADHPGARNVRRLAEALSLVDAGAESPYESLTRLLLVPAGFPRPQTQIPVRDKYGQVFARIDLGWPRWMVGVDFEGAQHWTDPRQREWDVERYARIAEAGWIDIRLTARTLHRSPHMFLNRVAAALIARGCPKTW